MKRITLIICVAMAFSSYGQGIYKGVNGKVNFFSDALLEDIEAETNKASSVFNSNSGDVAVLIPVTSFVFDKALMQEHFNENYMESDKYPDAILKGKIMEKPTLKTGERQLVTVSGKLTIHGVTQAYDIPVFLKSEMSGELTATGKFKIAVKDHQIKIPRLVFQNIAEVVEVSFDLKLKLIE